ncbi:MULTISPECIES: hypothetical protein [Alphaproteobacteria]
MTKPNSEVARWFDAIDQLGGANFGEEVFPGYFGAVVADGALVSITWGFPLSRKGAKGQPLKPKPVNNTRADKLDARLHSPTAPCTHPQINPAAPL